MKALSMDDIERLTRLSRGEREGLDLAESRLVDLDLSGQDLSGLKLDWSDLERVENFLFKIIV